MKQQNGETTLYLEFDDNRLLSDLVGEHDRYLKRVEEQLGVVIHTRGNQIAITGEPMESAAAYKALSHLYDRLDKGLVISGPEVDASIRMAFKFDDTSKLKSKAKKESPSSSFSELTIPTQKMVVTPKTEGQESYIRELKNKELVFSVGPAGTGKTYLAVAMGVSLLLKGEIERIILTRPAVEAGEQLGFLPGDLREKVDPYLRPLYDALYDMIPPEQVEKRIKSGEIEIAPLAFMRGRTLSNAYVILDEGQNTLQSQMRMFLTRMGNRSRVVITGDLTQVDLPRGVLSGLRHAIQILKNIDEIGISYLEKADVVRHKLVKDIIDAYEKNENITY